MGLHLSLSNLILSAENLVLFFINCHYPPITRSIWLWVNGQQDEGVRGLGWVVWWCKTSMGVHPQPQKLSCCLIPSHSVRQFVVSLFYFIQHVKLFKACINKHMETRQRKLAVNFSVRNFIITNKCLRIKFI